MKKLLRVILVISMVLVLGMSTAATSYAEAASKR